jgi:hypothetical protein
MCMSLALLSIKWHQSNSIWFPSRLGRVSSSSFYIKYHRDQPQSLGAMKRMPLNNFLFLHIHQFELKLTSWNFASFFFRDQQECVYSSEEKEEKRNEHQRAKHISKKNR